MRRTPAEQQLYDELCAYEQNGCALLLDGQLSTPGKVVHACFREHCSFMRDIVEDENSVIRVKDYSR